MRVSETAIRKGEPYGACAGINQVPELVQDEDCKECESDRRLSVARCKHRGYCFRFHQTHFRPSTRRGHPPSTRSYTADRWQYECRFPLPSLRQCPGRILSCHRPTARWSRFVATKLTPVSRPGIAAGGRFRTTFPGLFPNGPAKLFPQHFNPSESTPHPKCCASEPVAESERTSPFNPTTSCTTSFERFSSG